MNILIATDGSEDAGNALNFLLRFPLPRKSKMTVLSVVDDIPLLPAELDALNEVQVESLQLANQRLKQEAEELVTRESMRLREDGWPSDSMVRNGNPVNEVLRVAEEIDADLIVMGSHGVGMARRFLLGSVSERVLEHAHCSVMIVKSEAGKRKDEAAEPGAERPRRIMLAYDGSDSSREALELCASLPLEQDSEVSAIYVMPLITAYRQDVRQHINSIWLEKERVMREELENAVRSCSWTTPDVSTQVREAANVSEEILNAAEQAGADMIMFGCKDKSAVRRFLLGSITRRLSRYAKCTVWAVRKKTAS